MQRRSIDANGGTVGFVGLGRMGWPMAANLRRAGYELIVRDADVEVELRFADQPGAASGREATAFAAAGVVITMLPDGRAVQEAVLGDGIADALSGGAVVIDMSSSDRRRGGSRSRAPDPGCCSGVGSSGPARSGRATR